MKKLLLIPIFSVTLFATGCVARYEQIVAGMHQSVVKLERNKGVFIATPKNGSYGSIQYPQSGNMTAQAIRSAFSPFTSKIFVSNSCTELEACLFDAKNGNYDYLVFSEILYWEDRATEWSGKPDRIEVKLSLLNIHTKDEIHSVIIKGKSKWATLGGDHPQDLLPDPINSYVLSLY